jgi:parallel beta-helix repeat protein
MKPIFRGMGVFSFAMLLMGAAPPDDRTATVIRGRQVWEGSVVVKRVLVEKDAVLEIKAGTKVRFVFEDRDGSDSGNAVIEVKGKIIASGEAGNKIIFRGDSEKCNKAWRGVEILEGGSGSFTMSVFKCAEWGINIRKGDASVSRCQFEDGYGGIRVEGGNATVENSAFDKNQMGIRLENSSPKILNNDFRGNTTGIFIKEGCSGAKIAGNNFTGHTEYAVAIGESQKDIVDMAGNWWGSTNERHIKRTIFERANKGYTGIVKYTPFLVKENEKAGP